MYEIYEVTSKKEIFPFEVSKLIHADDTAHIELGITNLIEKSIPYVNQHRIKHSKGNCIVNATAIIFEENNKPLIIGSSKAYLE
ncbi:MAG: hypothetical protein HRT44_08110 [Bdellovibrionales bacterium]|nr:PAS domain-containing protein [Bdellovibrionales bacterium]NQZ19202.1 hypothetical protein [Bdellovibrionales bacterium]